nr:MAG: replication associated protein [Cressdnaviricota sp.]
MEMEPTTKKFKAKAQCYFLTYPQAKCTRSELVTFLREGVKFKKSLSYVCVSEELHQDGNIHFHAQVQFSAMFNAIHTTFDLNEDHPNVQKSKNSRFVNDYVKKKGNFVEHGIMIMYAKKPMKPTNKMLLEGDLVKMIDNEEISGFSLAGILNFRKLYADLKVDSKPSISCGDMDKNWNELTIRILPTSEKRRHYWLYSSMPNLGKTSFLEKLAKQYRCYFYNCGEKFQTGVKPDTQLVLFDEYAKGNSIKITDLNSMCDGNYSYMKKGQPACTLNKPYIFVCSNFSIADVYPNSSGRIEARFNEIDLSGFTFMAA